MNFASACKKFFGQLPGQTLQEFGKELQSLTPADKTEMADMLSVQMGETVTISSK